MKYRLIVIGLIAACGGEGRRDAPPSDPSPRGDKPPLGTPHVQPDELEKIAYRIVDEDKTLIAYVVYLPQRRPRPIPKYYDLAGYRIFIGDDWELEIMRAERGRQTTIVADEYMVADLAQARAAPPDYVEEGNESRSLRLALNPKERVAKQRGDYKLSCLATLRKILGLADDGTLVYLPKPVLAEVKKVIDSDDYYDVCRAINAMIAFGIVAPADEHERGRWAGNLDEPWSLLAKQTAEAIARHKKAGGTVFVAARPESP